LIRQRIITAVVSLLAILAMLFYVPYQVALFAVIAILLAGAWEWSAFLGAAGVVPRYAYVVIIGALIATALLVDFNADLVFAVALLWWLAALV